MVDSVSVSSKWDSSKEQRLRYCSTNINPDDKRHEDDYIHHEAMKESRTINVALVGNPNCGKTSLFNFASGAHGHVGNYSGVTVDATEAHASMFGYEFNLTDLPGTYSLSCYSPEELYVREHLTEKMPDVVINVIDASNLERNLYLTTQLVDMNIRMCRHQCDRRLKSGAESLSDNPVGGYEYPYGVCPEHV